MLNVTLSVGSRDDWAVDKDTSLDSVVTFLAQRMGSRKEDQ